MSLLSRRFRVIGVSVTLLHDLMEDAPDGVEVGLFRFSNRYHSQPLDRSITPGISGERPFNVHERNAEARVRCMPLLGGAVKGIAQPKSSIS
jgi:hypothetical protein